MDSVIEPCEGESLGGVQLGPCMIVWNGGCPASSSTIASIRACVWGERWSSLVTEPYDSTKSSVCCLHRRLVEEAREEIAELLSETDRSGNALPIWEEDTEDSGGCSESGGVLEGT